MPGFLLHVGAALADLPALGLLVRGLVAGLTQVGRSFDRDLARVPAHAGAIAVDALHRADLAVVFVQALGETRVEPAARRLANVRRTVERLVRTRDRVVVGVVKPRRVRVGLALRVYDVKGVNTRARTGAVSLDSRRAVVGFLQEEGRSAACQRVNEVVFTFHKRGREATACVETHL